jgi:hypothetical protein
VEELPLPGVDHVRSYITLNQELCKCPIYQITYRESAIIDDARETQGTIHADHIGMTKFSTRGHDNDYQKVADAIGVLLEEIVAHEAAQANSSHG